MTKRVSLGERLCHKVQVVLVSCSSNGVMILQPPWPPKQPWALVCLWVVVMGMKFPISVVGLNFHKTMDFSQSRVEFFLSIWVHLAIILFMDFRSLMMALSIRYLKLWAKIGSQPHQKNGTFSVALPTCSLFVVLSLRSPWFCWL